MAKARVPSEIYQVKITLVGSQPPIWRRLLVPAEVTLYGLHVIIQAAFGWAESHLHQFILKPSKRVTRKEVEERMRKSQYMMSRRQAEGILYLSQPDFGLEEVEDETEVTLQDVESYGRRKEGLRYEYDFGDGWMHEIRVEKTVPFDPQVNYPLCIDGQQAAPLEDCGGIYGWYELLARLADPAAEGHEDALEWVGDLKIDPERFDRAKVNKELPKMLRRKKR